MSNEALGWVFRNSPYSGTRLVVHLAIADVVNEAYGNRFFMLNENLATKCNTTRQTANAILSELVDDGFLERLSPERVGRGKPVEYRFIFKDVSDPDTLGGSESVSDPDIFSESVSDPDTLEAKDVSKADTYTNSTNPTTNKPNEKKSHENNFSEEIQMIWKAYLATLGRCGFSKKRMLDEKRKKIIRARLNEGWTTEELIKAVEGLEHSSFHRGDNDKGTRYDKIELILRSAEKVEQFIGYHEKGKPKSEARKHVNDLWNRSETSSRAKVIQVDFLDE